MSIRVVALSENIFIINVVQLRAKIGKNIQVISIRIYSTPMFSSLILCVTMGVDATNAAVKFSNASSVIIAPNLSLQTYEGDGRH